MALINRNAIKQIFKRFRKPKESEYSDTFDSLFNKVDDANMSVTSLTATGNVGGANVTASSMVTAPAVRANNHISSTNTGMEAYTGILLVMGAPVLDFSTGRILIGDWTAVPDNGVDILQAGGGGISCSGFRPGFKRIFNEASEPYTTQFDDHTMKCGSATGVNLYMNCNLPDGTIHIVFIYPGSAGVSILPSSGTLNGGTDPINITDPNIRYTFQLNNPDNAGGGDWEIIYKSDIT